MQRSMRFRYDVIVIGLGRVGLPLSLYLEKLNFKTLGLDKNIELINKLKNKNMPFVENGCDKLIKNSKINFTSDYKNISNCKNIVITVGSPLLQNIETDLSAIKNTITNLIPYLKKNQNIILRSTLAPRTTIYVKKLIEKFSNLIVGKDIGLSFCPERLAENRALYELKRLPQIIGADDKLSKKMAIDFFKNFKVKLFSTTTLSSELVKLFQNTSRYIEFATANLFSLYANNFNQNIHEIIEIANYKYPRGKISKPGLTSGTCLRKDFGFINELNHSPDLMLSAWKINEYMPLHIVNTLKSFKEFKNMKIGILGATFKKDSDDLRDSLVPKLIRYLEREVPKGIKIYEPNIKSKLILGYQNLNSTKIMEYSNVIIMAINHSVFSKKNFYNNIKKNTIIVDLWNTLNKDKFIFVKK